MKNTNNKVNLLNKFILFSSSLLVIFLFGVFIGSKIKQFKEPIETNSVSASSAPTMKVNIDYKVIKEIKKIDLKSK